MLNFLCKIVDSFKCRWHNKIYMEYQKRKFGGCGTNVTIMPKCDFVSYKRIYIGNNVYIGPNAQFVTTEADVKIGNYVLFGPNVSIVTGNHRIDVIGEYMFNVKDKLPENDQDVIIEDDVWVGMNAMILKGVTIGKGSVIAGGAIVTKSVLPYSIYLSRDKIIPRFTEDEIIEHEKKLKMKYGV